MAQPAQRTSQTAQPDGRVRYGDAMGNPTPPAAVAGVLVAGYWLVVRTDRDIAHPYRAGGRYWFDACRNHRALAATEVARCCPDRRRPDRSCPDRCCPRGGPRAQGGEARV
ncbi:cytosine permease [Actinokineospora iranica]|uniref:Permease for cytosine/purines, uracil, thiamine, allantoin n=1 Tax=Actinokineospora iranica TaxID=1271860 RepID=A0A1G6LIZ4_9PSEU|nr:cytosine permease [Actinokineospora iranica]SDC43179.1 Permease for cytosine/purines, uracil, thiamine, allantoin [Actinokineospora iranica]